MSIQLVCAFSMLFGSVTAQVAINTDGSSPDGTALLDIKSDEGGILLPRMTAVQKDNITTAVDGLLIYQTPGVPGNPEGYYMYNGGSWHNITALQTHRGEVNMGNPPVSLPGGTLDPGNGVTFSYNQDGIMNVALSPSRPDAHYTVLISPEHVPNPNAPIPPLGYCVANHSGNCTSRYENRTVIVTHPAGAYEAKMDPFDPVAPAYESLFYHKPGAGSTTPCDNGVIDTDYYFHSIAGTTRDGFSANSFNNPYTVDFTSPFVVFTSISAIPAGDTFDLMLSGNEKSGPTFNMNSTVFIDWNSDGDFFDSVDGIPEKVLSTGLVPWPALAGPHSYAASNMWALQVPTNAVTGPTTMRVMATRFNNNSSPCMVDFQGSTRDYVFTISGGAAASRPGENRFCNVANQTTSGFQVKCYDDRGNLVNDKVYITINPN